MLRLGVAKDRGNLSKVLRGMISAKKDKSGIPLPHHIGMIDFGVIAGVGRLSRLHFLAPLGAELLTEVDPDGPPAKPIEHAVRFRNDYFHRVRTIDFHITMTEFADANGHKITLTRQYYNRLPKHGKTLARPSTSIDLKPGYIDPDSIYRLTTADDKDRLLLVEIANGHKVDRIAKKIPEYARALETRKINNAFEFGNKAVRVLWLFEHARTLELVQERLKNNDWAQAFAPHFFLRTMDECTGANLLEGWQTVHTGTNLVKLF